MLRRGRGVPLKMEPSRRKTTRHYRGWAIASNSAGSVGAVGSGRGWPPPRRTGIYHADALPTQERGGDMHNLYTKERGTKWQGERARHRAVDSET
jgi:hypothetical protein